MAFDYYTKTTRSMLGFADEVGPKPFILFQYYKTYETAPDGIRPSLDRIARDLRMFDRHGKPAKSAVSNLNKILVDKKWIIVYKGEYFLIKSFRNSEREAFIFFVLRHFLSEILKAHSDILNGHSEILNAPFRNSESSYIRNENESLGIEIENKNRNKNFLEEVEQNPVQISSSGIGNDDAPFEDSDDSAAQRPQPEKTKTEVPPSGEGENGNRKTEVPSYGEGKPEKSAPPDGKTKPRKKTEDTLTRSDIPDDADWLVWLKNHARYAGIDVLGKYRDMLDWCGKNKKTPSRLRLVNWLNQERSALPMKAVEIKGGNGHSPPGGKSEENKPYSLDANGNPHPLTARQFEWESKQLAKYKSDGTLPEDVERFYTPEDWRLLKKRLEVETEVTA